jgi:alkyl sulfatase BDS1-like metallo-beta-lactamase superfamily hydrolase
MSEMSKTTKMEETMLRGIRWLFAAVITVGVAVQAVAIEENKSNLWFGGDEGIEVVWKSGKNLAYAEDDPKIVPHMTARSRTMEQALLKIGERTYLAYGWDITSPMMVVGDDGLIIVDPPMAMEAGQEVLEAFRRVTDKPVKAIVYTHNHIDHVSGVKAFTNEEDVASGKVDIYAHETLIQGVINWASTVGPIEGRRTSYTAAVFLPKGPDGSVHDALGPVARPGTVTFIPPSKTFSDTLDVTVAGVKMHLLYLPSETEDEIIVWFPEEKLLNSAEVMQGENFPNIYTIRGTKYRDPVKWFKSIDVMREFPAEYLVPTHGRPIVGYDNIQNMLTAYRDAIQFVHDQTIRYMNQGYTPEQLVELVVLPPHLAEHPWLSEDYGSVKHVVRNIYGGYLGWFQADPWTLDPMPYMERAERYVKLMGGRNAVLKAAKKAVNDGEYTWAAEILTNVIRIDNNDMEARNLKAEAYRQFAYTLTNVNWRNWSLTAAAELEGKVDMTGGFAFTSSDVIRAFTTDKLLEMITTRIDPEKSIDVNLTMGFKFNDTNERYALEIRRGVVQFHTNIPDNASITMVTDRDYMNRMLVGDTPITGEMVAAIEGGDPAPMVAIMAAIDSGEIRLEGGTKKDVQKFFSYFDKPVDVGAINLIVR